MTLFRISLYTPEIPTDEDGYDGDSAGDQGEDNVVDGDVTYWENVNFLSKVTVVYSGESATVTADN